MSLHSNFYSLKQVYDCNSNTAVVKDIIRPLEKRKILKHTWLPSSYVIAISQNVGQLLDQTENKPKI